MAGEFDLLPPMTIHPQWANEGLVRSDAHALGAVPSPSHHEDATRVEPGVTRSADVVDRQWVAAWSDLSDREV
jgi:hypothetical protein